jgi:hypothetical protein
MPKWVKEKPFVILNLILSQDGHVQELAHFGSGFSPTLG